jgi:hypothetical protein
MRRFLIAGAAALALPAVAPAATSYRTVRISYDQNTAKRMKGVSASFLVPSTWTRVTGTDVRHLSFRTRPGSGGPSCSYSITFTVRQAADTQQTPAERVAAATPTPSSAYLLETGTRKGGAWRVTRLRSTDGRVRLLAQQSARHAVEHRVYEWVDVIVSAISSSGSECHTGTYRDALGPQIGVGLASVVGSAYDFARRG